MSLLEVLPHAPQLEKYTSLVDHQSATPASFFNTPSVLHFRCQSSEVQIPSDLLLEEGPLRSVFGPPPQIEVNGIIRMPAQVTIDRVQVIVGSDAFLLSPTDITPAKTLSIPYPLITLHALQHAPSLSSPNSKRFNIYLQVSQPSASENDELTEITVTPNLCFSTPQAHSNDRMAVDEPNTTHTQETLTKALFKALTNCADLHPTQGSSDAVGFFSDGEDGEVEDESDSDFDDAIAFEGVVGYGDAMDLDPEIRKPKLNIKRKGSGFPGDGGWITSENVHLIGTSSSKNASPAVTPGGLGPGAGSVRPRDDSEDDGHAAADGAEEGVDGAKWRRTH